MAGDADRHAVALELDLGEPGFVEQLRQIADDIVVDRWRLRHGRVPGLARHDQSLSPILARDHVRDARNGERVALHAAAGDHRARRFRNIGVVAEFLALVDIGDVHLDDRHLEHEQRIEDGDRRCRVSRRIDDEADGLLGARLLNPIDDFAFVIGLAKHQRKPVTFCGRAAKLLDVGERRAAVKLRLAACRAD